MRDLRNTARVRIHMIACVVAITASTLALPSTSVAQEVPADISALYEELRIAIEMEDIEAIKSHFTPLLLAQTALGQGWAVDLYTIFGQRENLAAEVSLNEVQSAGDKTFALVTWAISGKTTETGDPWNTTIQRADVLIKLEGVWQLLGSDDVDAEAFETKIEGRTFTDAATGLEVQVPPEWRIVPLAGYKTGVMALSPDLTVMLTWVAADLPGAFTTEQIARSGLDAIQKLAPALNLEFRDVSVSETTLAGRPAYISHHIVAAGSLEAITEVTYCVVGSVVYVHALHAIPPTAIEGYQQEIEQARAATKITGSEVGELPPEAGRVEGRKYINDVYGCEIIAPGGWEITVGQGRWKLQVSMHQPGGDSFITLGMIDLPSPEITAEQAILGDDNVSSQAFDNFKLIRRGETKIGDLRAYESISQFKFGNGLRQRWRVYLVDDNRLFFMFADAVPADAWDRVEKLFKETFQSFRLFEARSATETP